MQAAGVGITLQGPARCLLGPKVVFCAQRGSGLTQLVQQGEAGWVGVAAPPRQRRARLSVFEVRSRRPVGDSKTSPGTASRASKRVPRIRENGRQFFA